MTQGSREQENHGKLSLFPTIILPTTDAPESLGSSQRHELVEHADCKCILIRCLLVNTSACVPATIEDKLALLFLIHPHILFFKINFFFKDRVSPCSTRCPGTLQTTLALNSEIRLLLPPKCWD